MNRVNNMINLSNPLMIIVITILIYHINELFSCKISEKKFTSE